MKFLKKKTRSPSPDDYKIGCAEKWSGTRYILNKVFKGFTDEYMWNMKKKNKRVIAKFLAYAMGIA